MSIIIENTIEQMEQILDLWVISYDEDDQKYIARTCSYVVLNNDQLEQIKKMGLTIFSIQKIEHTLIVRFSSGGGY